MKKEKSVNGKLERDKLKCLTILSWHTGEGNAISMSDLYIRVFERNFSNKINDTRPLRGVIKSLRRDGVPVCASDAGYFIAADGSELSDYCSRIRHRALSMLSREAKLRKTTLPELLGQIQMTLIPGSEATI